MQLYNFDIDSFLKENWQKKPLVIRNPWSRNGEAERISGQGWCNPVTPDELAGLACEEDVESRLINQCDLTASGPWAVENGPIPETRFSALGQAPWTLLVQAVDHHVPAVAALLDAFRFIPNWRIDDVMVSYASDGGGVGPHFDHYDVFLIQGLGRRRWQVGTYCDDSTELLPHDDLRLLAHFEPTGEWVLEPGDILYVPPGIAHNGVALGDDCMTYSIGFRAPSRSELIADWCDDLVAHMNDDDRYSDPGLARQDNSGEIAPAALSALHAMIAEKLADRSAFARWFGCYTSTPKYADMEWQPEMIIVQEDVRRSISNRITLHRNPASRFVFVREEKDDVLLFVDGECYACTGETARLAENLCTRPYMALGQDFLASETAITLITQLSNRGSVAFEG